MSERLEVSIEGEDDFPFDEDNIQELDHFDIGEDEDPEEVAQEDAGVWQERVPLTRQKRKQVLRKPGRKRTGEIIHIPKRQPPRAVRVKSYQQYDAFDELVEQDLDDSDPEVMDDDGEPSTSKTWRIFVRKDGSGMHFDWPIFMDSAVSLKDVVNFISTDASEIPKSLICTSIPQEFTNTGTFIIHLEEGLLKEEICNDGLGTWNSAQMFVRKYVLGVGRARPLMTQKNDHNLKIVCEQFIHPGTDSRGDFIRRIYTGFDKDEHMIPYVVICYEWMGQPHPLTVYEDQTEKQAFEQMTWKKCSNPEDQVPILARHGCDYNSAVAILLSSEKCTNYGKSVPQFVQECISFVIDINECGGDRALFLDGNEWQRPSGSHRFFRILYPNQDHGDFDTWNIERASSNFNVTNSDIQIICRRYNGQKYSQSFGFVRKIYLLKILPLCPPEVAEQLHNRDLAVISYSYRNAPHPTFVSGGNLENLRNFEG
ncbi:UBX domain-containing protein [Caenorhabditis elegans]|uniref:UBX domain-containing protein n=1 Tax=Caenorhabditis elegans TaxID=6239 RepID=U4PB80_CAEEL|nr:UBX domain-containing protein [Caenorhabditis elegans]CDH93002.1 UBX domain-containing protein [Caenorhabditis elegans]|eukprot:NP_001294300.1 Uncharacterized protein CELE_C35B1.2 [Caenorhabditis elegans]